MSERPADTPQDDDGAPMRPEDAVRTMAAVTSRTRGLRTRTEGLTLVVWGLVIAASYLTIVVPIIGGPPPPDLDGDGGGDAADDPVGRRDRDPHRGPPTTTFFATRFAPLIWYGVGAVVTVAVWHSAALSFQTGLTTPRLVAVFVAWLAVFLATIVLLAYVQGGNPRSWHLVGWAVVIGLLAALNPLRFTRRGRVAAGVVALVALAAGAYAQMVDLGGRDVGFLSGVAIGVPSLVTGLYLMFRG